MGSVVAVNHIGVSVADLDAARAFWTQSPKGRELVVCVPSTRYGPFMKKPIAPMPSK